MDPMDPLKAQRPVLTLEGLEELTIDLALPHTLMTPKRTVLAESSPFLTPTLRDTPHLPL